MRTDLSALRFNQLSVVGVTALSLVLQAPWLAPLLGFSVTLLAMLNLTTRIGVGRLLYFQYRYFQYRTPRHRLNARF